MKNDARLRPATAAYHGRSDVPLQPIAWPDDTLSLSKLFVIAGDDALAADAVIEPSTAPESYMLLLQQATRSRCRFPPSTSAMRDYLALTASVPVFRLTYRRSFDRMDAILDVIVRSEEQLDGVGLGASRSCWCYR